MQGVELRGRPVGDRRGEGLSSPMEGAHPFFPQRGGNLLFLVVIAYKGEGGKIQICGYWARQLRQVVCWVVDRGGKVGGGVWGGGGGLFGGGGGLFGVGGLGVWFGGGGGGGGRR